MRSKKHTLLTLLLLLTTFMLNAQETKLAAAIDFYSKKNLDSAKTYIELVINNKQTSTNPYAWYIRGFIYKEIYNKKERSNNQSQARLTAMNSFKQALKLDTANENSKEIKQNIRFLASTMINDVTSWLVTPANCEASATTINKNHKIALENWNNFKEAFATIGETSIKLSKDSMVPITQYEHEISSYFGSFFLEAYKKDHKINIAFSDSAKKYFNLTLLKKPNNVRSLYGMGLLYYNQAIFINTDVDYGINIEEIDSFQNEVKNSLNQSRPFMEKVYSLDPNYQDVRRALCLIYYNLNVIEKLKEFDCKVNDQ